MGPVVLLHQPLDCRAIFSLARLYAPAFKRAGPIKTLRRLAERIDYVCDVLRYAGRQEDHEVGAFKNRMDHATSLAGYEECTNALDKVQGHDIWKEIRGSIEPDYDPSTIEMHLEQLQQAAVSQDINHMQFLIQTSLSRDLGGMNALRLYKHSWFGTKRLIDDYINTAVVTIDTCVKLVAADSTPEKGVEVCRDLLKDSLKCFGRTALTLSGGAGLGMKHIGVAKCLWESELLPDVISGASAGSIVAGIIGASTDEEMLDVLERFPQTNLAVFDPPGTSQAGWIWNRLVNFFTTGAFFRPEYLQEVMKEWLKDITFGEAFNKTQRILNICVSSTNSGEPRLLNMKTAPDVYIWSAVCASCAVPGVFPPACIYEKDPLTKEPVIWMQSAQQMFVDGSLDHDIPMRKLTEMFHVNFFIVSQVNPHVRIFLAPEEKFAGQQPLTRRHTQQFCHDVKDFVKEAIIHRAQQMADWGFPTASWRWASLLNQQYTGDINILPEIEPADYVCMMMNPTPAFMSRSMVLGERATWPKMCRIKNCVAIELALRQGIRDLDERLHFSPTAREARRRQGWRHGSRSPRSRSAQPNFLRRRSLSVERYRWSHGVNGNHGPPTPPGPGLTTRRNLSLGQIDIPAFSSLRCRAPPYLSPQAGVENDYLGDGLVMTVSEKERQP